MSGCGRHNHVLIISVQILSRRTKNNPVVIGEPGVGKTAVAEGLAQRIVAGVEVWGALRSCSTRGKRERQMLERPLSQGSLGLVQRIVANVGAWSVCGGAEESQALER